MSANEQRVIVHGVQLAGDGAREGAERFRRGGGVGNDGEEREGFYSQSNYVSSESQQKELRLLVWLLLPFF